MPITPTTLVTNSWNSKLNEFQYWCISSIKVPRVATHNVDSATKQPRTDMLTTPTTFIKTTWTQKQSIFFRWHTLFTNSVKSVVKACQYCRIMFCRAFKLAVKKAKLKMNEGREVTILWFSTHSWSKSVQTSWAEYNTLVHRCVSWLLTKPHGLRRVQCKDEWVRNKERNPKH